jgi:hypothetical protein
MLRFEKETPSYQSSILLFKNYLKVNLHVISKEINHTISQYRWIFFNRAVELLNIPKRN